MKNLFNYSIFILTVISLTVSSCEKKYVDGPHYSLRTAKARVSGDWKLVKYLYNNADSTSTITGDYIVKIEKGETYSFNYSGAIIDSGTWALGEDKDDILFTSSTAGSILQSYRLLRLKNKELWWKQTQSNGDIKEFHFLPA